MARTFATALEQNALPTRLGDVQLRYDTHVWVGRADRPPRTLIANASLVVGLAFGVAALAEIFVRADSETIAALSVPCVAGLLGAAFIEQRDRRQRAFAVDFDAHVLRLDFSTRIGGMPRTLHIPFEQVRDVALEDQSAALKVLTVDFEAGQGLFREVLVASVTASQLAQGERVKRMLRAAVGLDQPPPDGPPTQPAGPPPVVDSFG